MEPITQFRPMSVGDILDVTFKIYKSSFITFIAILAIVGIIGFALMFGLIFLLGAVSAGAGEDAAVILGIGGGIIGVVIVAFSIPLVAGAMIHAVSAEFLGQRIGAIEAYKRAMPRLLFILFSSILVYLMLILGLFLFIIGYFIFIVWFCLTPTVAALEDEGVFSALGRSRQLMKGNYWKGLGLLLIIGVLGYVVGFAAEMAANMFIDSVPLLGFAIVMLGQLIVIPLQVIPFIVLYYDMRIRKEGFDMEMLAVQLGASIEGEAKALDEADVDDGFVSER